MATATPGPTPNPDAMRFSLDVTFSEPLSYASGDDAATSPLAEQLLAIDGVASIFATADFITVTRVPGADWAAIIPAVQDAVAAHL